MNKSKWIPLDPKRDEPRPGYDNDKRSKEYHPEPKPPADDVETWAQKQLDKILEKPKETK